MDPKRLLRALRGAPAQTAPPPPPPEEGDELEASPPLAFYLSYLPATPAHDFRFMYPATLAMQAITLASLMALVQRSGSRSRTT